MKYETKVKQALETCLKSNFLKGAKREKALVMYSGGMDSVSLLWNILEHTEQEVHVHFIEIENCQGRHKAEAKAVADSLNYMRNNQRPFTFSCSGYSWIADNPGGRDMVLALFQAMRTATGLGKRFNAIYTGDYNLGRDEETQSQTMINTLSGRSHRPSWLTPFEHMTKTSVERSKGIYLSMPEELRQMYWSCRKPTQVNDKFVVCGECHACERQEIMMESLDKQLKV